VIAFRGAVLGLALTAALATSLAGCALLRPAPTPPRLFVLEGTFDAAPASDAAGRPSLLVPTPAARAGYDSPRIAYVTKAYELQFFAQHEWVDTPARMLAPLLVEALESSGRFQTVPGSSGVSASLRLDTEIMALQQEFASTPSRVRFGVRAQLVDVVGRRVVATRELEAVEVAPSDDPYGGVVAANVAVIRVLRELAEWAAAQSLH
jgi:cholesterol transport system auxiliary component